MGHSEYTESVKTRIKFMESLAQDLGGPDFDIAKSIIFDIKQLSYISKVDTALFLNSYLQVRRDEKNVSY